MSALTIVVLAKAPRPGFVKTRLVPPLTYEDAAAVAAAALRDTLAAVDATPARHRILALDGDDAEWQRTGWSVVPQPTGGLDRRIAAALAAAPGPVLLVGMDTPQLQPAHLLAFDPDAYDAGLGPAEDGGYWVIGLRDPGWAAAAVLGVPMSQASTGAVQLSRLRALGLRVQLLPRLTDVDTIETAEAVAGEAPSSRFAATLAALRLPR